MNEDQRRYLEDVRKSSGLTHQQISELSGIPVGTVSRIFAGQTKDPGMVTVAGIVLAMGGSLDELFGEVRTKIQNEVTTSPKESISDAYDKALEASRNAYQNAYSSIQAQHEIELQRVKSYLRIKDRWLILMFGYSFLLTIALILICVVKL